MKNNSEIIEIKEFSQEIFLLICQLTIQLTGGKKSFSEEAFHAIMSTSGTHLFIIYDNVGKPVGMTTLGIYHTPTGRKAWIEDVTVDEVARGGGYGRKIVEHAIEFARNQNVETISLTSNPSRIAANKLYQSLGFEKYETNLYKLTLRLPAL